MFLDYAGIRVVDLDRSVKFYTEGLHLRERRRGTMEHGGVWVLLEDAASHQQLELNWYPPGSKYATPFTVGEGLDHLGIRVVDPVKVAAQLTRLGATEVDSEVEDGRKVVIFLTDPDGLWLELIETEAA